MAEYTQMATIPKTAKRCKDENLGITEWNLREWCKSGALKHIRCGTKFRNHAENRGKAMIYILAGIVASVALIGAVDAIVNLWDWLEKSRKG